MHELVAQGRIEGFDRCGRIGAGETTAFGHVLRRGGSFLYVSKTFKSGEQTGIEFWQCRAPAG